MNDNTKSNDFIHSEKFKAGRRTYFFDVKKTRTQDFFITITESKKFTNNETGEVRFDKHKIFLYEEDFDKFIETLNNSFEFINKNS